MASPVTIVSGFSLILIFSLIISGCMDSTVPAPPGPSQPTAHFTANITQGRPPLIVQFTDQSVSDCTTLYAWDVTNDGTTDYTIKNPVHTYATPGTYTVKLTVTNGSGSESDLKTDYITVLPFTPADTDAAADSESLSGIQIFPKDHIWNVPISALPADPESTVLVQGPGASSNLAIYRGIPYNVVNNTAIFQNVSLTRPWSDFIWYPVPPDPLIEPGGNDRHMIIVDRDNGMLYEFYKAGRRADGTWSAQSGFVFNLSGYALRPPGHTTADAAGLPILPGLVRYDEVREGEIDHALRVTVPATNHSYVWPARANGNAEHTDGTYPAMGQRFRLKSSFDTSGYPTQAKTILEALKKYGMMVSDMNGETDVFELVFAPDSRWNSSDISTLFRVHGSDFEAVDVSSLMINESSGQVKPTPPVSAPGVPGQTW